MQKHPTNLLNLQNLMKRDPGSYEAEMRQQWQRFLHQLRLLQVDSQSLHQPQLLRDFTSLLSFLSHVASCFPSIAAPLPEHLLQLLTSQATALPPSLRLSLTQALILLQNRGLLSRFTLLPALFSLFAVADKPLRCLLHRHIVADMCRVNRRRRDVKLNSGLQSFMYGLMADDGRSASGSEQDDDSMAAKQSLDVMVELWRRRVWTDAKTVNVIASACFSPRVRIMVTALRFFLGLSFYDEEQQGSDEEEEKKAQSRRQLTDMKGVVKRRKRRERQVKRAVKKLQHDRQRRSEQQHSDVAAIQLLHDPQAFAERLFSRLRSSSHSFPVRLLLMNVVSRLIGAHSLLLLNFYPFVARFLQPHQRHVTSLLAFLAQACHPLVPPDVLRPLLLSLAHDFVTDRSSTEVMTVGINAIREICSRQPLVMTRSLLLDLAAHKKSKSKGVMMASRAVIALYRERLPELLKRRERGKAASLAVSRAGAGGAAEEGEERDDDYAKLDYAVDVAGAEMLKAEKEKEKESTGSELQGAAAGQVEAAQEDEWEMADDDEEDEDDDDEEQETLTAGEVAAFLKQLDGDHEQEQQEEEAGEQEQQAEEQRDADELEGEIDAELDDEDDEDGEGAEDDDAAAADEEGEDAGEAEEDEQDEDEQSLPPAKKQRLAPAPSSSASSPSVASPPPSASSSSLPYAATTIFTPKDFALLQQMRLQSAASSSSSSSGSRSGLRKAAELSASAASSAAEVVDAAALKGTVKRRRLSKEERLRSVLEGRDGTRGGGVKAKGGGSTNADKLRAKPFMLVRHSAELRDRQRQSFSATQHRQHEHVANLRRQGKKVQRRIRTKRGY